MQLTQRARTSTDMLKPRKNLSNSSDLAINGAEPAFDRELYVGTPNIGDREYYFELMNEVFDRRWLSNNGPLVQRFERELQSYLDVKHVIAVCNGTIGLELALRALNLRGDILIPSYTFVATAHAPYWHGLRPVFVDIDSSTHTIDPDAVWRRITPETSAILATHLWGNPADIERLQAIADQHGLALVFDAAHAFGCSYKGRFIGNFGRCEVFSFHATKFLNTFEGGAICTNDSALADRLRLMRNFGFAGFDTVVSAGTNAKMTETCAAMGLCNMRAIDAIIARNRSNYDLYRRALAGIAGLRLLPFDAAEKHNFQYIVLEVDADFALSRDALVDLLWKENVIARKYFWPGCHNMEPYRSSGDRAMQDLPKTDKVAARVITLPTGTGVSADDIETICRLLDIASRAPP